uniref:(northern house mosquito) hypothetical protein n=1 Tax=Culex pipiens TaxID=7175 RepID=A0A8D8L6A4_CULPI
MLEAQKDKEKKAIYRHIGGVEVQDQIAVLRFCVHGKNFGSSTRKFQRLCRSRRNTKRKTYTIQFISFNPWIGRCDSSISAWNTACQSNDRIWYYLSLSKLRRRRP